MLGGAPRRTEIVACAERQENACVLLETLSKFSLEGRDGPSWRRKAKKAE